MNPRDEQTPPKTAPERLRSFKALALVLAASSLLPVACGDDATSGSSSSSGGGGGEAGGDSTVTTSGRATRGGSKSTGPDSAGAGDGPASGGMMTDGPTGPHQSPDECTANQVYNGVYCATCPPCDGQGEAGPYATATLNGMCICRTKPGYFYSTGAEVGTFACDKDGDGWVRASARGSLEARGDEALRANARCDLRAIDRFTLVNEAGHEESVEIPPVELYESDRNDDDGLLAFRLENAGTPPYGETGKNVSAAQINPLTKFCQTPFADYNDNGLADVSEWEGSKKPPTVRTDQAVFIQFSYFAELFNGRYQQPAKDETYGQYVIQERSRLPGATPSNHVSIGYGPTEGTYWQQCTLLPDAAATTTMPPVGMDFASLGTVNFHSQFKCLSITTTHDAKNPNALLPSELGSTYRLNSCKGQGQPTPTERNPDRGAFKCSIVDPKTATAGDVLWGAVRYVDYSDPEDYIRGCANDCQLPGEDCGEIAPGISACIHDAKDFGRKTGCAEQCDGKDNDGDGVIDNGTNDLDCSTAYSGVCAKGKTRCKNGKLSCFSILPGEQAEVCDALDQDCDGSPLTGTNKPNPQVGQLCTVAETFDTAEGKYKPLVGQCKFGVTQCIEDKVTKVIRLSCVSDLEGKIPVEAPCDNADNDCDGDIDETRTKYEGDDPVTERAQCSDGIDNNCDGVTDQMPRNLGYAAALAAHTVEICGNNVDDDCDGTVDEKYESTSGVITGPACAWACDALDQGATACSHQAVQVPPRRYEPAGAGTPVGVKGEPAANLARSWFFDPPWFNEFWKVIKCQDGYWQLNEVCGLNATRPCTNPGDPKDCLKRVNNTWGGNLGTNACKESAPRSAACTSDTSGLANIGCSHDWPPSSATGTTNPPNCLECWPDVASDTGCYINGAP
jgi:hypothetical protein